MKDNTVIFKIKYGDEIYIGTTREIINKYHLKENQVYIRDTKKYSISLYGFYQKFYEISNGKETFKGTREDICKKLYISENTLYRNLNVNKKQNKERKLLGEWSVKDLGAEKVIYSYNSVES